MFSRFLLICMITLLPAFVMGQEPPQRPSAPPSPAPVIAPEDIPSAAEYEKALKNLTDWSGKFDDLKSYKDITVAKGEVKKKFTDLSEVDQNLFIVLSGQNCSNTMMGIKHRWSTERDQLVRLEVLRQAGQAGAAQEGEVTSAKLAEFLGKLQELQKAHAKKFEATIVKTFEKYKADIPEKDAKLYLDNVRKFHDRFSLIDRTEGADE